MKLFKYVLAAILLICYSNPVAFSSSDVDTLASEVSSLSELVQRVNMARMNAGLTTLRIKSELTCSAQTHASDIGEKRLCSINGSTGKTPWEIAKMCGTSAYGVMVGCGYLNARDTVQGWVNQQETRDLLLNPTYTLIGVGMYNNFWVLFLGY